MGCPDGPRTSGPCRRAPYPYAVEWFPPRASGLPPAPCQVRDHDQLRAEDSNLQPSHPECDVLPVAPARNGWGADPPQIGTSPGYQRISDTQVGVAGGYRIFILASAGVRLPLRWLQSPHAATVLDQVFPPFRERGRTWSTVDARPPQ